MVPRLSPDDHRECGVRNRHQGCTDGRGGENEGVEGERERVRRYRRLLFGTLVFSRVGFCSNVFQVKFGKDVFEGHTEDSCK